MGHTEEDWQIVRQDGSVYIGTIEDKVTYGTMICEINLGNEQALANGKLMAAAPKLLELAYQFSIVMNQLSGRMGEQMEIEVNKMIEEAIEATK